MKEIPVEQIERVQYEMNSKNTLLIVHLRSLKAFQEIPLTQIDGLAGFPFKHRTVYNPKGETMMIYFYPPAALASMKAELHDEPVRVALEEEDFAYFPA